MYFHRINQSLHEFQRQYNNHPVRTEGSQTPYQIFVTGMLANRDSTGARNLFDERLLNIDGYGIEEEGPVPASEEPNGISVEPPRLLYHLTSAQEAALEREIQSVTADEFGIPQYLRARTFLRNII